VTFEGPAWFQEATFEDDAWFAWATFNGYGQFPEVPFRGDATFSGATFEASAEFREATFQADARFDQTTFRKAAYPNFTRATFGGRVDFEGATFEGDAGFREATLEQGGRPRVVSVRRAKVGTLVLSDADLRGCRFVKAHNLDGLRLEGDVEFAHQPDSWWWARRRVLAEEHEWRLTHGSLRAQEGWYGVHVRPPARFLRGNPEVENALDASSIAAIYRDLRKGREDSKDEPGAADFYYGEMKMRRFDITKPRRTPHPLALLARLRLRTPCEPRAARPGRDRARVRSPLYAWGFPSQRSFLDALTFSAESTTSLFHPPERELTLAGEWLQIGLRLLGPFFFGLALLSLRGRVKR
jgi:hypothetical protein